MSNEKLSRELDGVEMINDGSDSSTLVSIYWQSDDKSHFLEICETINAAKNFSEDQLDLLYECLNKTWVVWS